MLSKINKCVSKKISLILLVAILSVMAIPINGVRASNYEGSGTKASPYLIKTPQQLDDIRNNMTAYYKLAGNIDMSGYESSDPTPEKNFKGGFVPIGTGVNPFKGTFTCDIGSDGQPIYEIKNLKISNAAGTIYGHKFGKNNYTDYQKNSSYWEASLFGITDGATLSNLLVTNADVNNTVLGQHQINGDWSPNPGQDEMGAAILATNAKNSKINGCIVSGKVNGCCNGTAGFVARATKSTISQCAAYVKVSSTGLWNNGGFIGVVENSTIKESFLNAENLDINTNCCAAFFGVIAGTVENCYAVGQATSGNTFVGKFNTDIDKTLYNSFSLISCSDGKTSSGNKSINNSYIGSNGFQSEIKSASNAELLTAFSSLKNWDVTGEYPQLKNKKTTAVSTGAAIAESNDKQTDDLNLESGTEAVDVAESSGNSPVLYVNGIDVQTAINTLEDKDKLEINDAIYYSELKKAFDSLSKSTQAKFDEAKVTLLNDIYYKACKVISADITDRVDKLPSVDKLLSKDADEVMDLKYEYTLLSSASAKKLDSSVVKKLNDSLIALGLEGLNNVKNEESGLNNLSKTLLIVLIVLNAIIIVAAAVFLTLALIKLIKKGRMKKLHILNQDTLENNSGNEIPSDCVVNDIDKD